MSSEVLNRILEAIMLVEEVVGSLASEKGVPLAAVGASKLDRPDGVSPSTGEDVDMLSREAGSQKLLGESKDVVKLFTVLDNDNFLPYRKNDSF